MAMDLPAFIRSLDPDDLENAVECAARMLEQSPRAIRAYLYGERVPRPPTARKMIERAKGRLSFSSIYGCSQ